MVSISALFEIGASKNCAHGCAPGDGNIGSLLGLDELLAGVGALSTLVGLAEQRDQDLEMISVSRLHGKGGVRMLTCCLNSLVEDGSQGDGRGLDGREVCKGVVLAGCANMADVASSRDP